MPELHGVFRSNEPVIIQETTDDEEDELLVIKNKEGETVFNITRSGGGAGGSPSGAAGGVLGGTYPNPDFDVPMATQAELDQHVAANDPHPGYQKETERGAASGYAPLDGNTKVPAANLPRLNELTAPNAAVALNSQRITGLAEPSASSDAATKGYVDAASAGLDAHDSVRVATTANIALTGEQTIDGIAVVAGDRVLVKDQSTSSQNGIYVAAAGAWSRSTDADTGAELSGGSFTFVEQGTANANKGFVATHTGVPNLGTDPIGFTIFTGTGGVPSGPAGGVLSGTYPNPGFAADMATQAELDLMQPLSGKAVSGGYPGMELTINSQTGTSYTLVLGDSGKIVSMSNASPNTLTVPPNASVAFPIGTRIAIRQAGVGTTTLVAGSGVTISTIEGTLAMSGQWAYTTLIKTATNTWEAIGGLGSGSGGASGIPASTVTAKGDILVATGNATVTRRGVGADGEALLADSSQATGVRWGTISSGSSGLQTTLASIAVVGATSITTVAALNVNEGMYIAVGAGTETCEVRRVGSITNGGLTLALTKAGISAPTKLQHATGEEVWVLSDPIVPLEVFGCFTSSGPSATPCSPNLLQAFLDAGEQGYGLKGSGSAGTYHTRIYLPVNDGTILRDMTIGIADGALDARIGKIGNEPAQFLMTLAAQMGTFTVNTSTNIITVSMPEGIGIGVGEQVQFYARPGDTLPAPLEPGRTYFCNSADGHAFTVAVDHSGTDVDLTTTGTTAGGGFVVVSPGLARLKFYNLVLYGYGSAGLNGLYARVQQPTFVVGLRAEGFPGPRGAIRISEIDTNKESQEGQFYSVMATESKVGIYLGSGNFTYWYGVNSELNDRNVVIEDCTNVVMMGGHCETGGQGTSQQQIIIGNASVSAGTFTVTFRGQTTAPIAYNASAATVKAALEALSTIDPGDITVTEFDGITGLPTGAYIIDFNTSAGQYRWASMKANEWFISVSSAGLTGGSYVALTNQHENFGRNFSQIQGRGIAVRDFITNSGAAFYTVENSGAESTTGCEVTNILSTGGGGYAVDNKLSGLQIPWDEDTTGGCGEQLDHYIMAGCHDGGPNHRGWVHGGPGGHWGWESVKGQVQFWDGAHIHMTERSDVSAPATNTVVIYPRDNGGKTELVARFPTGAIQRLAIEP